MFDETTNETMAVQVLRFKGFPGPPFEKMRQLLDSDPKRRPVTSEDVMRYRDGRSNISDQDIYSFMHHDVTTADISIQNDKGEVKLVHHEHYLATELIGRLGLVQQTPDFPPVASDLFYDVRGESVHDLSLEHAQKLREDPYTLPEIRRACWGFLARGNEDLFEANLEFQRSRIGKQNQYKTLYDCMGIHLQGGSGIRLVTLTSVDFDSDATDYGSNKHFGRLVGELAPEVIEAASTASSIDVVVNR